MGSSWKKVKSGKFSQVLSDRISERRRRGAESPLVVETGFPTSIIDLFVKNKDKLKNPLFKKHYKNYSRQIEEPFVDNVPSPAPPPPPPPSLSASPMNRVSGDGGGDVGVSGVVVEDGSGGGTEYVRGNMVSMVVFGLFLVVVLVLGTKMFVVGVTFVAFMLLFLEYLVKQQLIRPPYIESNEMINLIVKNVMGCLRIRKGCSVESNSDSKPVIEIEKEPRGRKNIEIKHNEIQPEEGKMGDCDEKIEVLYIKDIIRAEAREECGTRKSRGAKLRVKMREFLPKRLKRKKPKDVDVRVDSVCSIEEEVPHRELSSGGGSCLSSMSRDVDELIELSINHNEQEKEAKTQGIEHSSSSYVALVLVVLLGLLVGGRVLALILTVSWCLLLKAGGTMGRRFIEATILKSPAKYVHVV